jgi:hypothetical protein
MAVGHWTKSQNRGSRVFHHHHKISDPKSIIMPYIENLGLCPDWGVGTGADDHGSHTKNIPGAETFQRSPYMFNSDSRNSNYAQKSVIS